MNKIAHSTPEIEKQLGKDHQRGIDKSGTKWLYCPVNHIVSWNPGDYDNKWCHSEGIFVESLK